MIEDDAPVIYGIEFQSRALTAHLADTDQIRFFVGTQSLKPDVVNQVHEINFDDENNSIEKKVFAHEDGEIWHLACPPTERSLLASCYSKLQGSRCEVQAAVWKVPSQLDENDVENRGSSGGSGGAAGGDDQRDMPPLSRVMQLSSEEHKNINKVVWHPTEDRQLIGLADAAFLLWDIESGGGAGGVVGSGVLEGKGCSRFVSCKWNPHQNSQQVGTCNDSAVKGWDLRTMQCVYTIEHAHGQLVRELDFNPNKQYYVATCGDDCHVKFWDVRDVRTPLAMFKNHSHWVWSVRYNQSHDQLVLTSSSDWRVVLSNIMSLSSEPYGHIIDDEDDDTAATAGSDGLDIGDGLTRKKKPPDDRVIAKYEEHEDSVYVVEWSAADPWLFASLSFDGRLVINRVPRAEKYKILL